MPPSRTRGSRTPGRGHPGQGRDIERGLRGTPRGVHPRRAGRGRPRPRPASRCSDAGSRTIRGAAGADRDGAVHRRRGRPPLGPDGPAQGPRRARLPLLHQLLLPQGPRASPASRDCALLFPWYPLQRQVRVEGRAEPLPEVGERGLLRQPAARLAARRVGLAAVARWSPPTASRPRTPRWRRGSRARCRCRPLGRLRRGARVRRVLAGPAEPDARPVALRAGRRDDGGAPWRTERLAP